MCRDQPRGHPSEPAARHPRDVPSVDPSTLGRKTLYELASLKYCYISLLTLPEREEDDGLDSEELEYGVEGLEEVPRREVEEEQRVQRQRDRRR